MTADIFHCLGKTSVEQFLEEYWQKKPLLIRDAFPDIKTPVSAEELAGLACEDHVNARLVLEQADEKRWQVEFGPLAESRFNDLPDSGWSLLVSDIERHVPGADEILKHFRFIPDWRIDDLMISYAPEGGSVGAHTDAYDVFLIQLSGQRLWQIAEQFSEETLEGTDLCILKNFTAEQEWLVNAGDMLYLPPDVAHHGIAVSDAENGEHCMTASVGFRAPSKKTISTDYIHFINDISGSTAHYHDRAPQVPEHHAQISDQTISDFIEEIKQGLSLDRGQVKRWLGHYFSDNKAFDDFKMPQEKINFKNLQKLASEHTLTQSPYSNFLYSQDDHNAILFVDGDSYHVSLPFAENICRDKKIDIQTLFQTMTEEDIDILLTLYHQGAIVTPAHAE